MPAQPWREIKPTELKMIDYICDTYWRNALDFLGDMDPDYLAEWTEEPA